MTEEELDKLGALIGYRTAICHKEVLSFDEAVIYTGFKKSYLYKLTSTKAIPHYKPTGKSCYFRRRELEEWLTANPVATDEELNAAALEYCMKNKTI